MTEASVGRGASLESIIPTPVSTRAWPPTPWKSSGRLPWYGQKAGLPGKCLMRCAYFAAVLNFGDVGAPYWPKHPKRQAQSALAAQGKVTHASLASSGGEGAVWERGAPRRFKRTCTAGGMPSD
eukprot:scaffold1253_cov245-Pinguiococcus_pyrenoidosus.AAC.22